MAEQEINLEKEIENLDLFSEKNNVESKPAKRQRKKPAPKTGSDPQAVVCEDVSSLGFKKDSNKHSDFGNKLDRLIFAIDELNNNIVSLITHEIGKHAHEMTTNEYLQNVDGVVQEVPVQLPKVEENLNEFALPPIFIN